VCMCVCVCVFLFFLAGGGGGRVEQSFGQKHNLVLEVYILRAMSFL
jgi:hypothetical protein